MAALVRDTYVRRLDTEPFALNYPDRPTLPEINALLDQLLSGVKSQRVKRPKPASFGKSRYRGVYSERGRRRVKLSVKGKAVHVGYFDDELEAGHAYDRAARQYHGSGARVNFPDLIRAA